VDKIVLLCRELIALELAGTSQDRIYSLLGIGDVELFKTQHSGVYAASEADFLSERNSRKRKKAEEQWESIAISAGVATVYLQDVMNGCTPQGVHRSYEPIEIGDVSPSMRQDAAKALMRAYTTVAKAKESGSGNKSDEPGMSDEFHEALTSEKEAESVLKPIKKINEEV
jgi:hypothetical protein